MITNGEQSGSLMRQSEKPFVFISYSHKDQAQAMDIITMLYQAGVCLWYDKGIDPGSEWDDNIAEHIAGCGCMISIVSRNYLASDNCKDELKYARDMQKEILIVYIEECALPSGIALRINRRQAIMKYRYEQETDFHSELLHANVLQKYIAVTPKPKVEKAAQNEPMQAPVLAQIVDGEKLQLGYLSSDKVTAIGIEMDELLKRMLICAPQDEQRKRFICHIMLNLYQSGGSFVVFSSNASQYRSMLSIVPDLQVFTPGKEDVQPFPFNPFISKETRRLPLGQMITRIAHTLQLTLGLPPKAYTVLIMAIRQCARRFGMKNHDADRGLGWDEETVKRFSLRDVLYEYKCLVQKHYQGEEAAELMSICNDQLQEYMNQNSDVLDRVYSTPVMSLMDVPTLIEMDAMPGVESRALLTRLLLHNIYLLRKKDTLQDRAKHLVILIDDVNMLLDTGDEEIDNVQLISKQVALQHLLRELESTGKISVICVTETVRLFSRHLLQDMANKVVLGDEYTGNVELLHQLGIEDGISECVYGQAMLFNEQQPVSFIPDLLDEHFCATISDKDVSARVCYWEGNQKLLRRYQECKQCSCCYEGCDFSIRDAADEAVMRGLFRRIDDSAVRGAEAHNNDLLFGVGMPAIQIEKLFETYLEFCLEKMPLTSVSGNKQRFISCLRIRLAKELLARKMWNIPLSKKSINRISASMITDYNVEREQVPVGLDASGQKIIKWNINLSNQDSQQCFAIRLLGTEMVDTCEDELYAILNQMKHFVKNLRVLSWEKGLLHGRSFPNTLYGNQAVEQLAAMCNEAQRRAKAYRENPAVVEEMESQTWVIHLSRGLLEHLPRDIFLKPLMNFELPIRMRIIYLLSIDSSVQLRRDYEPLIPKKNSITLGFDSLSENRSAQKMMITGTVTTDNNTEYCRFIT